MPKIKIGSTESGDTYAGTPEAWARYHKAWADNDMELVEEMETGGDPEFWYAPDGEIDV